MENNQNNTPIDNYNQNQPLPDYNFIIQNSPKKKLLSFGLGSPRTNIIKVLVGFLILLIIFILLKGFFSSTPFSKTDFLVVLQDQNNILNIISSDITSPSIQSVLSTNNNNFATETALVLGTDQANTISYLKNNNVSFSTTQLNLGINPNYGTELNNALSSNSLNQTFNQIILNLLDSYKNDLSTCYRAEKGPIGRKLLIKEYKNANYLIKMVNDPKS
jgi:hypothetical protein